MSVICIDDHPRFKAANHNAGLFPVPTGYQRLRELKIEREGLRKTAYVVAAEARKVISDEMVLQSKKATIEKNSLNIQMRLQEIELQIQSMGGE